MLNVQLSTRQRKRGRTHLPALLIHVLETQPAAGSTSSVRALGVEEAVHQPCVIPPDTSLRLQNPGVAVLSCSCPVPKVPCWCAAPRTAPAQRHMDVPSSSIPQKQTRTRCLPATCSSFSPHFSSGEGWGKLLT